MNEKDQVDHAQMRKELIKGVVQIARKKEFYGHIIQQFDKIYVTGKSQSGPSILGPDGKPIGGPDAPSVSAKGHRIKTAAVGRYPGERLIKLWFNTDFFGSLWKDYSPEQARKYMGTIIEHEIIHVVFGHLFIHLEDKTRANVALDCVVNGILNPDNKPEVLPKNFIHPANYKLPLDKSGLWYYTHLRDNEEYKKQCASGAFGEGGLLSHVMSSHNMWKDLVDDVVSKEFAKDIIRKAKDMCTGQNYGDIPGRVIEQIDEFLKRGKPIIPWARVLRAFVASAAESVLDYTVKRRSRRFGTRPGTRKGDVLNLLVAIDTSGSISDNQLQLFWNEIRWVWKNGVTVNVCECDTNLSERSPFPFKGKWDGSVHGRGGTSLSPPLALAEEKKYDALIYFTDFYAPKIEKRCRVPILWVLTTELEKEEYPYQWGRHIKIEDGKARVA